MATNEIIQAVVSPVVMVSANGLLCLAFYNRLSSVVSRGRAMNKERVDLHTHLASLRKDELESSRTKQQKRRVDVLDQLGRQLLDRAQWVRLVIYCLLSSIVCMLTCSLLLGLSSLAEFFAQLAVVFFVLGTMLMMTAAVIAMKELRLALGPLEFETESTNGNPPEEFAA